MTLLLIVESNRRSRENMAREFHGSSHQVQLAATVPDAVCLMGSAVPDAVIVPVPYFDQSGFSTVQHVTQLFPKSRVLAIATSVAAVEYSRNTCVAAYRLKTDLASAVRELLALTDEGFWDGENREAEESCAPLAQHS